MKTYTLFLLALFTLSCSSAPTVRENTSQTAASVPDRIVMIQDTTVPYDPASVIEFTKDSPTDSMPKVVQKFDPSYPEIALRAGIQGNVYVQALIAPSGRVRSARILKTDAEILNRSALEAAMKWTFEPPSSAGKSVSALVSIPFRFAVTTK